MPRILIKTFVLFIFLSLPSLVKAQNNDYVITTNGDTLACKISELGWVHNGNYKTEQMKTKKQIQLSEIKEYYISKHNVIYRKVYKRANKPRSAEYLRVVENGKINLYEEINNTTYMSASGGMYSNSSSEWYISKNSDTAKVLKSSDMSLATLFFKSKEKRKNDFAEMIMDNKEVYDKYLADDKFSFKQIRDLVHLYNTGKPFGSDAARDYVITKTKDTIFCKIELGSSYSVSRYRVTPKDRSIKIDTTITAYFLGKDSSTFLLKTLPNDKHPMYFKCLVKGGINLYAYSLNNSAADSEASLYACKEQGDLIQIKNEFRRPGKSEKKAFTDLISDNPNLVEKFINLPYNFTSVLNCVKMYNSDYSNNNKPTN
jgi:hypothetical protein